MPLTKREAAVISAYTGFTLCDFSLVQELADEKLGRSTYTHEFANKLFWEELHTAVRGEFLEICKSINTPSPDCKEDE
ncbi:hypothetical protein HCJ66_01115 [Listeria sp. FSL L7-1582]|uniref:DUF7736 domain-containing protein n=1 Tax=Listeria portnoyi TaxID=2713504 RepID=UPI00164DEEF9|nr:hypothetical protein [Listeria portnoyi]MBC6308142.1 hypothetical protein [Listeria portnoyi]